MCGGKFGSTLLQMAIVDSSVACTHLGSVSNYIRSFYPFGRHHRNSINNPCIVGLRNHIATVSARTCIGKLGRSTTAWTFKHAHTVWHRRHNSCIAHKLPVFYSKAAENCAISLSLGSIVGIKLNSYLGDFLMSFVMNVV